MLQRQAASLETLRDTVSIVSGAEPFNIGLEAS
jgi:hypothetical protein